MATARKIVKDGWILSKVVALGQAPSGEQIDFGLTLLNDMLQGWNNEKLMKYVLSSDTASTTTGSFTICPSGDITATQRPVSISSCKLKVGSNYVPMSSFTPDDYDQQVEGINSSIPGYYKYDATDTDGTITVYPTPSSNQTFKISWRTELPEYGLNDDVELPQGYEQAMRWGLAARMGVMSGFSDAGVIGSAKAAKDILKRNNVSFGQLQMSNNLRNNRNGSRGIY